MSISLESHPCFNRESRARHARVHLPVAPACNVQCRFCDRRFDCVNESRPGVTSVVLTPAQAADYLDRVRARTPHLAVVGIAGPGDPFANPEETLGTLRKVRERHPDLLLCVATNGLAVGPHIPTLIELSVSHVTFTVNAVDPAIGTRVYAWMRDGPRVLRGEAAAALLWERQRDAIRRLSDAGILVKINAIVLPGVNDGHIPDIAVAVKGLGASMMNCIPLLPAAGTEFEALGAPDAGLVAAVREAAGRHLPQMTHCARCRADACGRIGEETPAETAADLLAVARAPRAPDGTRPYIAVASREGLLINQHLGEADTVRVFAPETDRVREVEVRPTPPRGLGDERWARLAGALSDCGTLLVGGIGPRPRRLLELGGMRVIEAEGLVEDALRELFAGRGLPAAMQRRFAGCGHGCSGGGGGCG